MGEKKKILIFIDWFTPGYKAGGPVRSVNNIVECFREENDLNFTIITRNTDYMDNKPYVNIIPDSFHEYSDNTRVYYCSERELSVKNFKRIVNLCDFDVAYINGVYSFYFSILPLFLLRKSNSKIIVAPRGMFSKQAFSSKSFKKSLFLSLSRLFSLYKNIIFQSTDIKEYGDLKKIFPNNEIIVVHNLSAQNRNKEIQIQKKESNLLRLVSIARISIEKNTLFAIQILGKIKTKLNIEFDIFGTVYDPKYFEQCRIASETLPQNIKINFRGSVPAEYVFDTFSRYEFAFLPTKGENFGHAIFEALASGCPVIISDQTPWRNLEAQKIGWDIALSDTEKFVKTIEYCAQMSQEEYNLWSRNAFEFAQKTAAESAAVRKTREMFLT